MAQALAMQLPDLLQPAADGRGRIHLLDAANQPVTVAVGTGVTDGSYTEVMLKPDTPNADLVVEGAKVITGVQGGAAQPASGRPRQPAPRLPF